MKCILCKKDLENVNDVNNLQGCSAYQPYDGGEVIFEFTYGSAKFDKNPGWTQYRGVICDECAEPLVAEMDEEGYDFDGNKMGSPEQIKRQQETEERFRQACKEGKFDIKSDAFEEAIKSSPDIYFSIEQAAQNLDQYLQDNYLFNGKVWVGHDQKDTIFIYCEKKATQQEMINKFKSDIHWYGRKISIQYTGKVMPLTHDKNKITQCATCGKDTPNNLEYIGLTFCSNECFTKETSQ